MNATIARLGRRLRLGVVGGGPGSFIGPVHRTAARLDDHYEVVAGVLSRNPERSRAAARAIGIPEDRAYADHGELLAREAERPDGIDVLAIMTPNDLHYPVAREALARGLDVICDKPLTTKLEDALDLVKRVRASGLVFCLTHNYTGYPMVRHARAMVQSGALGTIRQLHVEYIQGHLASPTEADLDPAANWRFAAEQCGPSLVLGDIGTHAHHLACFITGLELDALAAELGSAVPRRQVHDYAHLLLRFANGARGSMWVTNSAAGAEHGLRIRVYGDKGGLEWHQEEPNSLLYRPLGGFAQVLTRGRPGLSPQAERATRLVLGHPEGFHEAFANLYADAAEAIVARRTGGEPDPLALDFPSVEDGARGVKFVEAAVESHGNGGRWTDATLTLA
ncbi:MAG TPA: Gfo/Idh/MocA family oxidoreductase [Geminicoccaceae bacterium]|nr:Gfo/Idh/MocA family oxidoreductase [Geminicoccaceae bacterium]